MSLRCVSGLLRIEGNRFQDYAKVVTSMLLRSFKDTNMEVCRAAEQAMESFVESSVDRRKALAAIAAVVQV